MRRRTYLAALCTPLLAGCLGDDDTPAEVSFSGSGDHSEEGIEIEEGLTVIESVHEGRTGFMVKLVSEGGSNHVFAMQVGEYHGEAPSLLEAGTYRLEVDADGPWEVDIRQPRADSGDAVPDSLSGTRAEVFGPYEFEGEYDATGVHEGSGDFDVWIFPQDMSSRTLLFNELGSVDEETTFDHDGLGWVAVDAAGEWELTLS